MKTRHTTEQKKARRTLWREALMAIMGLTMGACSGSDPANDCGRFVNAGPDAAAQTQDSGIFMTGIAGAELAGGELEVPEDKASFTPGIEGPTVALPTKKSAEPVPAKPKPGVLKHHEVEGSLGVVASAMAVGVEKRTPLGVSSEFTTDVERVWAFIKVRNTTEPTKVRMVWKKNGKKRMEVQLRVGKSKGWRTWSYRTIRKRDVGPWTIDVLTLEGEKLHTMKFEIKPSQPNTDVALDYSK